MNSGRGKVFSKKPECRVLVKVVNVAWKRGSGKKFPDAAAAAANALFYSAGAKKL